MPMAEKRARRTAGRPDCRLSGHSRCIVHSSRRVAALVLFLVLPLVTGGQALDAATSGSDADPRLPQAVSWATRQINAPAVWIQDGATLCDKFVENAFGVTAQYPTAYDMYLALGKTSDPAQHTIASLQHAPPGVIVFFDRNAGNGGDGHVGIYLGNGEFVGVVTGGGVRMHAVEWWNDHVSHFLGWAYPRATWPGSSKGGIADRAAPVTFSAREVDKAARAFKTRWDAGESLARNLWGPSLAAPKQEPYSEAPSGARLVQYFDKGRMELTDPKGDTITNGLLANELITGKMQVGNGEFQTRSPAGIPIAGDADNPGPTYAALNGRAASLLVPALAKTGTSVSASVSAAGDVSESAPTDGHDVRITAKAETTLTVYDEATRHNVPAAFAAYRTKVGLAVIGYARSEPFLATVKLAGAPRQVMVQVFERRVLTYTASNPDPFKVEMGNIGQHYQRWRYS